MTIKYPQPIKFHKKTAQLQVDLARPKEEQQGDRTRVSTGCVFFTLARALDDNSGKMDWNNKILMKIDHSDIAKIVTSARSKKFPIDIFHKSADTGHSSTLKIEEGQNPGTYKVFMGKNAGAQKRYAQIYLNTEDMFLLFNLLEASVPVTLGWL
jgi:hypothetical protein